MKKKILIVSGDPNSINSEIIYKSWKTLNSSLKKRIYVISNFKLLNSQFKKLKYSIKTIKVNNIYDCNSSESIKIIDVDLNFSNPFRVNTSAASSFVKRSLNIAHKLAFKDEVKGIINCAINKKLMNNSGVTEYLASKCSVKKNTEVMLIKNKQLAVCPITTHEDIKNISKKINTNLIINKVKTINYWYVNKLYKKPRIAILGLNPHNAEFKINSEEKKIIIPALIRLKKKGINIIGPRVADTIFISDFKNYDVIVGMYHDQVLAPFKSLFKFDAINITLGLKYLRVSPDHGVALDIIKKNKANSLSLKNCINFLDNIRK